MLFVLVVGSRNGEYRAEKAGNLAQYEGLSISASKLEAHVQKTLKSSAISYSNSD